MRKVLQITGFFILCCFTLQVSAQDEGVVILEKRITLEINEQSIATVLETVSELAGIGFSYDPAVINTDDIISVNYVNEKLETILIDVLGDSCQFRMLKNQLIITPNTDGPGSLLQIPDPVSPDVRRISGLITDRETNEAIPYASISVLNEPFGTITNRDGRYELKIPHNYQETPLVFSCMGYAQQIVLPDTLRQDVLNIEMRPVDIRLGEIKVTAIDPIRVVDKMVDNIGENYPKETRLMTSFYREVLLQDKNYINVSEAVLDILKAPYDNAMREDRIRFLKGRKSPNVEPFKWVDFKMQGGPYYITKLDVVKTMDSFLDKDYRSFYRYEADYMIDYFGRPTYVILFEPVGKIDFPCYEGKLFIDQESFALVHVEFSLGKAGMKYARKSLIRKKPKGFNVRPLDLNYQINYKQNEGRWNMNSAHISVKFRVRSRKDNINSIFHSISDLLVTNHERTNLRRFQKDETFQPDDIFTEMIIDYDKEFWGDYNIIQPTDDLRKAIKKINPDSESLNGEVQHPVHKLTQHNN